MAAILSLAGSLALLPHPDRMALLAELAPAEIAALEFDWKFWARPNQLAPSGDWSKWLVMAGRGFGKTRIGGEWIREKQSAGYGRFALVGPTAGDARDVMVEGESGILAISPSWNRPTYEPSKRRLTWPNGAIATLYSAEEPDRLRGPQHDAAWGDEIATWKYPEAFDQLQFGLRLGANPQAVYTTTPKPVKLVKELVKEAASSSDTVVTRGSTYDNRANLAPTFFAKVVSKYEGTRLGRQELAGELLEDVEGALWSLNLIEAARMTPEVFALAPVGRTVVAVDPSVTSTEESDEVGIVGAMRGNGKCPCGKMDCAYVLRDYSGKHTPIDWARAGIRMYRELKADRVVAEVNNGGDLVETQFRVVDPNVSYSAVHASKGKRTRAEPIEALYEQGRVHHVGPFPQLEDELTQWVPDIGLPSPGRLDALVWGLTELMLNEDMGMLDYYAQLAAAKEAARAEALKNGR
jgi:phage terminase large subunit-like protein